MNPAFAVCDVHGSSDNGYADEQGKVVAHFFPPFPRDRP